MNFSNLIHKFNEINLTFFLTIQHIHLYPYTVLVEEKVDLSKSTLMVYGMNIFLTRIPSLALNCFEKSCYGYLHYLRLLKYMVSPYAPS